MSWSTRDTASPIGSPAGPLGIAVISSIAQFPIGSKGRFNVAQLLESLLEPSKTIPDEFSGYTLTKTDGTALVGRLVTRSREKIVMRDLTAQDHEVAAGLVKKLERLPQSLMPAGLVGAMSDQEIADLIAFLKSLGAKNKTRGEGAE